MIRALRYIVNALFHGLERGTKFFFELIPLLFKFIFGLSPLILFMYFLYINWGTTVVVTASVFSILLIVIALFSVQSEDVFLSTKVIFFVTLLDLIIIGFVFNIPTNFFGTATHKEIVTKKDIPDLKIEGKEGIFINLLRDSLKRENISEMYISIEELKILESKKSVPYILEALNMNYGYMKILSVSSSKEKYLNFTKFCIDVLVFFKAKEACLLLYKIQVENNSLSKTAKEAAEKICEN